jgi:glutathione-dependent formaldehyde-activating enzyme
VNLWIERSLVRTGGAEPASFTLRAGSGRKHEVFFCATCGTALWSRYHMVPAALFVRAGTLDDPRAVAPDVHLFTRSKLPWVTIPAGVPAFASFYRIASVWSPEQQARWRRARAAARRATDQEDRCPSHAANGRRASS